MRHNRDGTVLDVGRKTRTIPPAIRRALTARDHRCRFPGCNCRHCDAHHVQHWADGGVTRLDNLVMLCRRHHRAVQEEGFGVELHGNDDARFFWPDGRLFPDAPPAPDWTGTPLASTNRDLTASGITIDAETATPDWYGERLDLPWAIQVLRPPAPSLKVGCDVPAETPSGARGVNRQACVTRAPMEAAGPVDAKNASTSPLENELRPFSTAPTGDTPFTGTR